MRNDPIVTIGIPVYNGEKVIGERIKKILNQTFQDFVIVISDNNSNDKTNEICKDVSKNEDRITYYKQDENKGPSWNTNFVLGKAKTKYFVWAFADDIWEDNFLEENIAILENKPNVVGSIGDVKLFNRIKNGEIKIKKIENLRKFQYVHPVSGELEDKIKFYLNYNMSSILYAVFRTEKLKRANVLEQFSNPIRWRSAFACVLSIIREGDLFVTTNNNVFKEVKPTSGSTIQYMRSTGYSFSNILLYNVPFTIWFARDFGMGMFLQNFGYFLKLNIKSTGGIFAEIIRIIKRISCGQPKYW